MVGLPLDVWVMMGFSILVFFGGTLWALLYTLREEDRKLRLLQSEEALDTHSPRALRDLRDWIEAHPDDPDVETARTIYRDCVETLRSTNRHFYDWSSADLERLEAP